MKRTICIFILVALAANSIAQDSLKKPFFIKPYSVSVNAGGWVFAPNDVLKMSDYIRLAPSNELVKRYDTDYKWGYSSDASSSSTGCSVSAGFIFYNRNKKKFNNRYELKICFSYLGKNEQGIYYTKTERVRFDTLQAFHSNEMYLIDTVKYLQLDYFYSKKIYTSGAEFLIHTLQNRVLSFYTGLGIVYGVTTENTIRADYKHSENFEDQAGGEYPYEKGPDAGFIKSETTYLKNGQVGLAYIPVGGIIRFSRTRKGYVKRFALNMELKGGIKWEEFMDHTTIAGFFNANFGLKIYFNCESLRKGFQPPRPFY